LILNIFGAIFSLSSDQDTNHFLV